MRKAVMTLAIFSMLFAPVKWVGRELKEIVRLFLTIGPGEPLYAPQNGQVIYVR